MKGPGDPMG